MSELYSKELRLILIEYQFVEFTSVFVQNCCLNKNQKFAFGTIFDPTLNSGHFS
jgi:hypothetical protein